MSSPPRNQGKTTATEQLAREGAPRLRGATRVIVRGVWVVLVALNLVSFVTGIPDLYASVARVCAQNCAFVPQQQQALGGIGLDMGSYATIVVALACVVAFAALAMGIILFWRRPEDWMALVVAFYLAVTPIGNISQLSASSDAVSGSLVILLIVIAVLIPTFAASYGVFLLFPSGRFVPRWSWLLLIAWVIFAFAGNTLGIIPLAVRGVGYLLLYGSAILCQVHRYRRISNAVQRQQTKLVVVGFVASLLANQVFWLTHDLEPLQNTVYGPFTLLAYELALLLLPTTFFVAIQRYRLYDIDVLIRRTLVYGSLTVILALVYLGGVVGLQTLLNIIVRARSGESFSPPVIVVTTLAIAALFQPLRLRIQRVVDRRFYRSKYDARHAIEQFGASLRQQVDLPSLTGQLVAVVQATMEPTDISLWLSEKPARDAEK